jgi:hypothetical protein
MHPVSGREIRGAVHRGGGRTYSGWLRVSCRGSWNNTSFVVSIWQSHPVP